MARMIFFCKKCNSTYGADSGTKNDCPDCKVPLIETEITSDYWRTLPDIQKEKERKRLSLEYSSYWRSLSNAEKEQEREKLAQEESIRLAQIEEERKEKKQAIARMLVTSGFNFDGYRIVKYSGYISGDDAMSVDRGYAWERVSVRDELLASLSKIRRNALRELKEAAYDLGCNAVIGVDFDYITLDPQTANFSGGTTYQPYVFCVTANGNAVIIEKIED